MALANRTPMVVWREGTSGCIDGSAVDMTLRLDNAGALPTCPQPLLLKVVYTTSGKGSHLRLKKPGAPTIILPGNRAVLSPGVVKQALEAVGGHHISRLPDLLAGRL